LTLSYPSDSIQYDFTLLYLLKSLKTGVEKKIFVINPGGLLIAMVGMMFLMLCRLLWQVAGTKRRSPNERRWPGKFLQIRRCATCSK